MVRARVGGEIVAEGQDQWRGHGLVDGERGDEDAPARQDDAAGGVRRALLREDTASVGREAEGEGAAVEERRDGLDGRRRHAEDDERREVRDPRAPLAAPRDALREGHVVAVELRLVDGPAHRLGWPLPPALFPLGARRAHRAQAARVGGGQHVPRVGSQRPQPPAPEHEVVRGSRHVGVHHHPHVTLLGHGDVGHDLPGREAGLDAHRGQLGVERLACGRLGVDHVFQRRVVGPGEVPEGRAGRRAAHQPEDGSDRGRCDRDLRPGHVPTASEPGAGQARPMVPRARSALFG